MKCLIVGDVSPTFRTALQSKGYELVLKSKDDTELTGKMFDACIIDEQIDSTSQWELYEVNNMSVYGNEYYKKKKIKQKHKLPFWANNWRK